jgi:DNA-binding NtrC family response regulator
MSCLLIVDDDQAQRADVSDYFQSLGHTVHQARDVPAALAALATHELDVIISPVSPRGGNIQELLRTARKMSPRPAVIVEADIDSLEEGTEAVRSGAFGLLQKPYSLPELNFQIKRALEAGGKREEPSTLASRYRNVYQPYNFIGESAEIKRVFSIVNRVAATDSSVIILGETGTGKELVAGAIHYNSPRANGPFVRVNCAALPEQLLESELFGHEKGAFTSANKRRSGKFELANTGTILLDEIGEMSATIQAKLLRVIQEGEFDRVGGEVPIKTDVRIIATTNRNLREEIQKGNFREDLYYRLNVVPIEMPPLRERREDIPLLVDHFINLYAAENNREPIKLTQAAMEKLRNAHWSGNIRELENQIHKAVIIASGATLDASFFQLDNEREEQLSRMEQVFRHGSVREMEKLMILGRLNELKENRTKAAHSLDISVRTLRNKLHEYQVPKKSKSAAVEDLIYS